MRRATVRATRSMAAGLVCALALAAVGCDKKNSRGDQLQVSQLDGHARLGDAVTPTAYDLMLEVDPAEPTFAGKITIQLELEARADHIVLHAEELDIEQAQLTPEGGEAAAVEIKTGEHGGVAAVPAEALEPGNYELAISYTGALDEVPTGLYRVKEGDRWYAFTQFEPLEARQAFPSLDEPRFKAPFHLTVSAPQGLVVAANTPLASRGPDPTRPGWTLHDFQTSPPLPTYLVALTVGPLDVVAAPEGTIEGVPLRVLAPKGKGELAAYALEHTPRILAHQTEYFGQDYPFAKLDLVAVPNFSAGAMENVGLVTFRESLLLIDPETASLQSTYAARSVLAHELAHMWFGNLVTPAWWDELWLNESFATWMAAQTMEAVYPELGTGEREVRRVGRIMSQDSLVQTRAIRQPIEHGGDVYNAFDGITYGKGAAVLRMIEAWLSPEIFRAGVRNFLKDNAFGTGTTSELMSALEQASDEPVYDVMRTFIDQPGVPLLQVVSTCEQGQPHARGHPVPLPARRLRGPQDRALAGAHVRQDRARRRHHHALPGADPDRGHVGAARGRVPRLGPPERRRGRLLSLELAPRADARAGGPTPRAALGA